MAQGRRFEDSRGRGVATYRAGKQTGGDLLAKLGFWVVSKKSVTELLCLHQVQIVTVFLQAFSAFSQA